MVDPDPGYRPRRAADPAADDAGSSSLTSPSAAGPSPSSPSAPASDRPAGASPLTADTTPPAGTPSPQAGAPAPQTGAPSPQTDNSAGAAGPVEPADDRPKPLYRDEIAGSAVPRSGSAEDAPARGEETQIVRPLNFRQRRPQATGEDATTVLPRTGAGRRRPAADEDDEDRGLVGRRGRMALLVSAIAAVVVVGLAIMYAVASVGGPSAQPSASAPAGTGSAGGTPTPTDAVNLLGDETLLTPAAAGSIGGQSWTAALTQRGVAEDAPVAACLSNDPVDGEPSAQQKVVRLLTSSGKNGPSALHQAAAYATPEDAAQAYAVVARTFGGCASPGAYIAGGAAVTGLGDQAAGLVVNVITNGKTQWHSIVVSRTGRVLNVLDAARTGSALSNTGVAKALGSVTASQCEAAGGRCDAAPVLKSAPPPLGGDVPGFLATGDLPPAGKADEAWLATPAEEPSNDFNGSQCETVDWTRTGAEVASSRIYLVPSSSTFGLNEIVLTMKSEKAAAAFAAKIRSDLQTCAKRQLTAAVSAPQQVTGVGASAAPVTGWTATVQQKIPAGTQRYRVGIVSSGTKVAYTFLNPLTGGYDLSPAEWDMVAVRAGQRMTQVP